MPSKEPLLAGRRVTCPPVLCMQALLIFCAGGILGYSLLLQRGTSELSSEYGAAAATNTISLLNAHSRGTDNVNDPSSGEWLGYAIENGRRIIPEEIDWIQQNETGSDEWSSASSGDDHDHSVDQPAKGLQSANSTALPRPFYLHYVRFKPKSNETDLRFTDYLSILSGVQYLRPDDVLIHGDFEPTGPYWKNLTARNLARHVSRNATYDFGMRQGKPKTTTFLEHSADMAKLDLLLEYGGVAVDFDVFFIQGERIKDILTRKKAITCYGDEDGNNIGFVAARKDSKFIWAWRRSYKDIYVANDWNFNQAFVSKYLSVLYPEDVYVADHICNNPHPDRQLSQFFKDWGKIPWRNSIAIHSYERFGGVPISSFEDLQNANVTTHTILLRTIHFNAKIPPRSKDFKDEVIPPSSLS